jgi:hypothetical protein
VNPAGDRKTPAFVFFWVFNGTLMHKDDKRRKNLTHDSASQSKRRLLQMQHEELQAQLLRDSGYEVFSPTVVCDRIAIKDGKVYFVEFKPKGQELRVNQEKVRSLVPDNYLIFYSAQ